MLENQSARHYATSATGGEKVAAPDGDDGSKFSIASTAESVRRVEMIFSSRPTLVASCKLASVINVVAVHVLAWGCRDVVTNTGRSSSRKRATAYVSNTHCVRTRTCMSLCAARRSDTAVPSAASTMLMPIETLDAVIHVDRNSVGQSDVVLVDEAAERNARLLVAMSDSIHCHFCVRVSMKCASSNGWSDEAIPRITKSLSGADTLDTVADDATLAAVDE